MEEENQTESKDSVSLGGGIELNGFKDIEGAKMIVLKKIIGNYVKQIQEKKSDYEKISITREGDQDITIKLDLTAGGTKTEAEETQNNLFSATANAFKKILEQI